VVNCKRCKDKPIYNRLCKSCFLRYFEKKVRKTIREFKLIEKNDRILVACSGGKDSTSILYLMKKIFSKRTDLVIESIAIDEGVKGYRDESLKFLKGFCKKEKIRLHTYSFKKEFGRNLDEIIKGKKPCSICGVLRRRLLNEKARELKATKLVTGHNLDDECQSILMNQFRRNIRLGARLGPKTGVLDDESFVKRIKPFYLMLEKEIAVYAFLKGFMTKLNECPYENQSYRSKVRDMINEFEQKYPGTKSSIIASFLEIIPFLKNEYGSKGDLKFCKECGEPCSQDICQVCNIIKKIS